METPSVTKLVVENYRQLRLLGYAVDNAKREAAVRAARAFACTVAEQRAKLDYALSRESLRSVLGDLL